MARRMIAPLHPGHATQILNSDGPRDSLNDLRRSGSSASTHSLHSLPYRASNTLPQYTPSSNKPQVLRKPAPPPIPNKKPSLLSKTSSPPPQQRYRDDPPPSVSRKPMQNIIDGDEKKPALPPRQGSNGNTRGSGGGGGGGRSLLDDDPQDLGRLGEWEVLRPVR